MGLWLVFLICSRVKIYEGVFVYNHYSRNCCCSAPRAVCRSGCVVAPEGGNERTNDAWLSWAFYCGLRFASLLLYSHSIAAARRRWFVGWLAHWVCGRRCLLLCTWPTNQSIWCADGGGLDGLCHGPGGWWFNGTENRTFIQPCCLQPQQVVVWWLGWLAVLISLPLTHFPAWWDAMRECMDWNPQRGAEEYLCCSSIVKGEADRQLQNKL